MRLWLVIVAAGLAAGLAAGAAWAQVKLTEDPPVMKVQTGEITGTITPAAGVTEIKAVSRLARKTYPITAFDHKTGKFSLGGLAGDQTYDVCIKTTDGRTFEGIDLTAVDDHISRLAEDRRKLLGVEPRTTHTFDDDDVKWMLDYAKNMEDFMDIRRVLYVEGHGKRATMVVELLKADNFFSAKAGEVIWRIEMWYFEYQYGGWEQIPNSAVVLQRIRFHTTAEWQKLHLEYYPELSAHVAANGYSRAIDFAIPEKGDLSRGRLPNTDPNVQTQPHIAGLGTGAASQPASGPGQ